MVTPEALYLVCVGWGGGGLVLVVMYGGIVEPQDMPVLLTKTRQRWRVDRIVVEGTIDQICLFSFFAFPSLFSHPHLPSSFASSPANIHRLHAAANAFLGLPWVFYG